MSSTRQALEDYLAANPDDLAAHSAYADWLTENDDPRGEYIRLQLALEDKTHPAEQLKAIYETATAIFDKHEKEWIGPLYDFEFSTLTGRFKHENLEPHVLLSFRRGWIHQAVSQQSG